MSRTSRHRRWSSSWYLRVVGARALALTLLPSVIVNATVPASSDESFYPRLLVSATHPIALQQNDEPPEPVSGAPCNLRTPASHTAFIAMLRERSRTFHRQCLRLSAEPRLVVRVHTAATWSDSRGRAATQLRHRANGSLEADLHLSAGSSRDFVELIAHELEHVIERLDGVDLARAARRAPQLVWGSTSDRFETVRAIETGRIVAAEVKRGTP